MATLNLNDPQNGTTADASLIATNNAALKTVVNGGLEDGNIAADAAIGLSKLAGYPADNTKFLRGDGTWNSPIAGGFTPSAPATSLPVSPANLQQAILVDSTSAPTYAWLFQYSSSASKWIFIGGSPLYAEVTTNETTTSGTYAALSTAGPSITVPRAGIYTVEIGADGTSGDSAGSVNMSYDIGGTGAVDADALIFYGTAGTNLDRVAGVRLRQKTLAASDALVAKYKRVAGAGTCNFKNRWMRVTPVTVT